MSRFSRPAWILIAASSASFLAAQTEPKARPHVLLLGDSVYGQAAREAQRMLQGRVTLVQPKTRPGDSGTALRQMDALLAGRKWDLIHFNFGLADLHYRDPQSKSIRAMSKRAGGVRVTGPEQYEENLRAIVARLQRTGAKLLWASTTPIDPSGLNGIYDAGSEVQYNAIAARVMKDNGVAINDMHGFVRSVVAGKRRDPFSYNRDPLHAPIVRRILEVLELQRPVQSPVQVFVMVGGQTHIGGGVVLGRDGPRKGTPKGTLDRLVLDAGTAEEFADLLDAGGRWATRTDVWVEFNRRNPKSGTLGPRYGGNLKRCVGAEFTLGHALGRALDRQVYLFKSALGTPSLAKELRPPTDQRGKPGRAYLNLLKQVRTAVRGLGARFPDYTTSSSWEFAGLVLNLGEQDADAKLYESLLPVLIRSLRRDLKTPALPVVLVGTGKGGRDNPAHPEILAAQRRVAALPAFRGNVAYVETRDFWPAADARKAFRYPAADKWFDNAESFCRMGRAIGEAMIQLLPRR